MGGYIRKRTYSYRPNKRTRMSSSSARARISITQSQRQPFTPFSYTRWTEPTGVFSLGNQVISWNSSSTNTIIGGSMFCTQFPTGGPGSTATRTVKFFNGDSETVYTYLWQPTVAQPFLRFYCPRSMDVQSVNVESNSAENVTLVAREYVSV